MSVRKVVVGLSGGVDSSVAAALLLKQGYTVEAVYLECYNEPGCRTDQDKADALKVAIQLGIPFQVLDFRKEYKEKVIAYFYAEYGAGRTPNPDVVCNREVKFGIFYDWARESGYDYVATGHYARITPEGFLQSGRDVTKDQSYFLWQVPQNHLAHVLFPLGDMLKSEVRARAKKLKLLTASKPDSMGICFIGEVDTAELLRDRLGEEVGEVIFDGMVVGSHKGLWFYTVGSRGGFVLNKKVLQKMGLHPEKMGPLYVLSKDRATNQLIVGDRAAVMRREFSVSELRMDKKPLEPFFVRIRNLGELYRVSSLEGNQVRTAEPLFGIAEGQSAVFYSHDGIVLGGGIIA